MSEIRLLLISWLIVIVAVAAGYGISAWRRGASPKAPRSKVRQSQSLGLTYKEFRHVEITCRKCDWKGCGADMQVGAMYETGAISEYHCPNCGAYWGAVPWPGVGEESMTPHERQDH